VLKPVLDAGGCKKDDDDVHYSNPISLTNNNNNNKRKKNTNNNNNNNNNAMMLLNNIPSRQLKGMVALTMEVIKKLSLLLQPYCDVFASCAISISSYERTK